MPTKTLSRDALNLIQQYLSLPFSTSGVPCPYFNNKRSSVRGALRVLIGKGTPEEVVEEAKMFALRERRDLDSFSEEQLQQFLVEHNLGLDCSGFAYHVLDTELAARKKKSLKSTLRFATLNNPIRKFLARLRSVENTNVSLLAHSANSTPVTLQDIQPGDMIVILASKKFSNPNHILIVHEVVEENGNPLTIQYTHSFQWPSEGKFNHGVRQGTITITDATKPLLEQTWTERGESGEKNYTLKLAQDAEHVELRRLLALA